MYRWSSLLADSVFANLPPGKEIFVPSKFILFQSRLAGLCEERWKSRSCLRHIPAEAELGEAVPLPSSSPTVNTAPEKYYLLLGLLHLMLFVGFAV